MEPNDPEFFRRPREVPWPTWLEGFRDHQIQAARECVEAFERGAQVVFLDAPTGSGKTLIAEMVRRMLGTRGTYVCNGIELQHQFERDYPYAMVLKGRSNYRTELFPAYSCDDCAGKKCTWCNERATCPYQVAKKRAFTAAVGVLNTAYLLAEANSAGQFSNRQFVVVDECDTLESLLMGYVEFRLSKKRAGELGVELPVKAARAKTVHAWFRDELIPAITRAVETLDAQQVLFEEPSVEQIRARNSLNRLADGAWSIAASLENEDGEGEWGSWVRDYDNTDSLILKPVKVNEFGETNVWKHAQRWLCMSASIVSVDEQIESLGLQDRKVELVTVPMTFPVENRPIVYRPRADVTYKNREEEIPKLIDAVKEALDEHPDDNVLLHTVSYFLTREMAGALTGTPEARGRRVLSYTNASERRYALEQFRAGGGVLCAPSMDRGIDLPDDLARVVGVCKVPFPGLGDRQVSERLRTPGGNEWYGVQVARTLVQMTGRGVRHEDDWCKTIIFDKQFGKYYGSHGRRFLPTWWKDALTSG